MPPSLPPQRRAYPGVDARLYRVIISGLAGSRTYSVSLVYRTLEAPYLRSDALRTAPGVYFDLMLPETQDCPTPLAEQQLVRPVSGGVVCDLGVPVVSAGLGRDVVLGASVPEAAIHKHEQPRILEYEVWPSRQFRPEPVPHPKRPQLTPEQHLRYRVTVANARHLRRPGQGRFRPPHLTPHARTGPSAIPPS